MVFDPNDSDEFSRAELELMEGWDLGLGFQMTYMIEDDTPLLGGFLSGQPLVFFPYLGVSHVEYDVELKYVDPGSPGSGGGDRGVFDRSFEDDLFMIGFDLDIPLPGSHWDFTHALTFGFRWTDSHEQHDLGPFRHNDISSTGNLFGASGNCTTPDPSDEKSCFTFEDQEGWRVGLYYRVTWNNFGGFFRRNIFGPVD